MARFEIKIIPRTPDEAGSRRALGPVGRILATLGFGALAAAVIVLAFVLGYLVLSLAAAGLLLAVLVALIRATLRGLRH